jgi:hypothetical protein
VKNLPGAYVCGKTYPQTLDYGGKACSRLEYLPFQPSLMFAERLELT